MEDVIRSSATKGILSKNELLALLELASVCLAVSTDDEVRDILGRVSDLVPVESIVAGIIGLDGSERAKGLSKIINVSYPIDWVALYAENEYVRIDPVVRNHCAYFGLQIWSNTFKETSCVAERRFISHASDFGLTQGVTSGAPYWGGSAASVFSFAGRATPGHARHLTILRYLTPYLHHVMGRVPSSPPDKTLSLASLTNREKEVLQWVKIGKTNWEISCLLRVSERTVKFHIQNAMRKLNASTRSHAVVIALSQGVIEF